MGNPVPGLVFGGFLIIVGGFMLWVQRRSRVELNESDATGRERTYLSNRIRRRTQVAGMIFLIGLMIPIGDSLIPWQNAVATFAIYWLIVLFLALWTILLAFADIAATRLHSTVELARLKRQQQELEQAAQQLREIQQSSGDARS